MSKELSQFDQLKADITVFVSPVSQIAVKDALSGQKAIEAAKTIKGFLNKLEGKRKELVSPLNDQVKLINSYAKDIEAPLLNAERHIKGQLIAFEEGQEKIRQQRLREEEQKRKEIEAKALAEQERVRLEFEAKRAVALAAVEDKSEAAELFGTHDDGDRKAVEDQLAREEAERQAQFEREAKVRAADASARAWDINATRLKNAKKSWKCEATDLSKVPREFLVITLNTAAVLAAARGGTTEIPGVRIWQETGLAIGAHTHLGLSDPDSFENFGKK